MAPWGRHRRRCGRPGRSHRRCRSGVAGRVFRFTEDIGAVVDAVEVDRLAVVVHHLACGRGLEADHGGEGGPAIDVRHYLVVLRSCRNFARPPHQSGTRKPPSKPVPFMPGTARCQRRGKHPARHRCCCDDDDRIGRICANGVHDPADVVVEFQHRIRVVAEMSPSSELRRGIVRVVHLHEVDAHEERPVTLGMALDVGDRRIRSDECQKSPDNSNRWCRFFEPVFQSRLPTRPGSRPHCTSC